ncbi:MAG: hypothetical protein ACKOVA_13705 [Novosphingobium sp.]
MVTGRQGRKSAFMKQDDILDLAKLVCGFAALVAIAALTLWRAGAIDLS